MRETTARGIWKSSELREKVDDQKTKQAVRVRRRECTKEDQARGAGENTWLK